MTGTAATAAAARAARTRTKHDRWIRELSSAGWTVIRAGHVTAHASVLMPTDRLPTAALHLWCERCGQEIADWRAEMDVDAPLPKVLHAVTGHTCTEERS